MKYSSETNQILMAMYKSGSINKKQIPHSELRSLFQDRYILNSTDYHNNNVYLTDKGKAYVEELESNSQRYKEEKRRSWIQFWIPVVISIISLIGAYRQELALIIQAIMKLLK